MDLLITLSGPSKESLQKQLYEALRDRVLNGTLKKGQKLPPSRELARSLGISRTTVTLTYETLISEGYLEARVGAGTFVGSNLPDRVLNLNYLGNTAAADRMQRQKPAVTERSAEQIRLSEFAKYLRDNRPFGPVEEPPIQFSFGRPDIDAFPMEMWLRLMNHHAKNRDLSSLELPKKSQGYLPLRQSIADYLHRVRGVHADPKQIIIVSGSQQALDLVARVLIDRGDAIGIEDPCYVGAKTIFEANGAKLFPVPVDQNGLIVENLRKRSTPRLNLVYVTPSHQFPTGVSLKLSRRLELLEWAAETGTYIVEDDYDSEFRYNGKPLPGLAGLDQNEKVIYMGTFSKTLFVSLRLGYLIVPHSLVGIFAHAKWLTDRHSPLLEQQVLADFIGSGAYERHIRKMRSLYERKRTIMLQALNKHFGNKCQVFGENTGMHVLVSFRTKMTGEQIEEAALRKGVCVVPCIYVTKPLGGELVLCYGGVREKDIEKGIKLLSEAIKTY